MLQGVSYVQISVVYIKNLRPDSRNIPSSASLAYRAGAQPNFAITEFCEVRLPMAKATVQTSEQITKQKN